MSVVNEREMSARTVRSDTRASASHRGTMTARMQSDLSLLINSKNATKKLHVMHLRVLVDFTGAVMGIERRMEPESN
jgi:hypothetical protein